MPLGDPGNLTEDPSVDKLTIAMTHPGMAFFAGTGPAGKTCGDCRFKGYPRTAEKPKIDYEKVKRGLYGEIDRRPYRSNGCLKYKELTGLHGPPIESDWVACKYFEQKK